MGYGGSPSATFQRPADLHPEQNGKLFPNQVVPVLFPGIGMLTLHALCAQAWNVMALIAQLETGRTMTCTSAADALRTFALQERAFFTRYGRPYNPLTMTTSSKVYQNLRYWLRRLMAMVATPGTSNHGWGCAVDGALWVQVNGKWRIVSMASDKEFFAWLKANASRFGFYLNVNSESWHLEYCPAENTPLEVWNVMKFLHPDQTPLGNKPAGGA